MGREAMVPEQKLLGQKLLLPAPFKPGLRGAAVPSAHLWASFFFYVHIVADGSIQQAG